MIFQKGLVGAILCIAALSACSEATPPTISTTEIAQVQQQFLTLAFSPITPSADVPTAGSARYSGYIGAATAGDLDGFIGDLQMNVNFGSGNIGGAVTDINVLDENNVPTQQADGSLAVSGTLFGNSVVAIARGDVSAVDGVISGTSAVDISLGGNFVNANGGTANAIVGNATGGGSGDFDFTIIDGDFFATR